VVRVSALTRAGELLAQPALADVATRGINAPYP